MRGRRKKKIGGERGKRSTKSQEGHAGMKKKARGKKGTVGYFAITNS